MSQSISECEVRYPSCWWRVFRQRRGVTLVEILVSLLVLLVVVIATLNYFAYGMGGIGKQGHRRAALERARQRLEQIMAANVSQLKPADANVRWLSCTGSPCTWTTSTTRVTQAVAVDDLPAQPMETTVQWRDDPASAGTQNALELSARVWFTQRVGNDDKGNRVLLKTVRAP